MTTTVQRQVAVPPATAPPPSRRPLASGGGWFTVPYLVAFVLFLVIQGMNRLKKKEDAQPAAPPAPTASEKLLSEIRDLLKNQSVSRPS